MITIKKTTGHGANLFTLAEQMGCSIDDFKDFSSNINPFGISKKAAETLSKNIDKASIYPDPAYRQLKENISLYSGCSAENILLGSGASSFINSFIKLLDSKNAMIFAPAYSEYENEFTKNKSNIFKYYLKEENDFNIDVDDLIDFIKKNDIDTAMLCNPNNPTGTILEGKEIEKILKNTNCNVIVDETYIEFTDTKVYSSSSLTDRYKNIFVIRGTSKFFATPGIRLGYALTSNQDVKTKFEKYYNILWDINIFADIMGQEMFLDRDYHRETFENITQQREYIYESLLEIDGLKPFKSYGNFILVRIDKDKVDAADLYEYLLNKKIIIRNCSSFEGLSEKFFRVCILKPEENKKLIEDIRDFMGNL